jgi:hypothetical protein
LKLKEGGNHDVDEDFLLVQKMRMGDENAFDRFVTKYYPAIMKYCSVGSVDWNRICGRNDDSVFPSVYCDLLYLLLGVIQ